jgi:hypothetical protein
MSARAKQLRYNKKLDQYQRAQRDIRMLYRGTPVGQFEPLDLEVVIVRPRWLCGTFAFHPMLGFRRFDQIRSIAHGCATTLMELGRLVAPPHDRGPTRDGPQWLEAWGVAPTELPQGIQTEPHRPIEPVQAPPNRCWLRPKHDCPFSPLALRKTDLPEATQVELSRIYRVCSRADTHRPREA